MAYIANKPVRFDRDYAIGEIIPDRVVDKSMSLKLVGMGRIIHIADPAPEETPAGSAYDRQEAVKEETGAKAHADAGSPETGKYARSGGIEENAAEKPAEDAGKAKAHSRTRRK